MNFDYTFLNLRIADTAVTLYNLDYSDCLRVGMTLE